MHIAAGMRIRIEIDRIRIRPLKKTKERKTYPYLTPQKKLVQNLTPEMNTDPKRIKMLPDNRIRIKIALNLKKKRKQFK